MQKKVDFSLQIKREIRILAEVQGLDFIQDVTWHRNFDLALICP